MMCREEDEGVCPVHRPREWRREERRLSKHNKGVTWHKGDMKISAPLIIDPVTGPLVER